MNEPNSIGEVTLSLCMATMNRSNAIGETFAGIAAQEIGGVELIIVDGSSDAATERVIDAWRDRLPPVRYERCAPQGFDRDYCRAVERSRGEYCWLISDDDPWRPGAIAAVKRAIAGRPDFVVVNGDMRGPDLREPLETTMMALTEDRVFQPGEDDALAIVALSYLSYVGAVVVRRELWMARRAEPYFGTDFVHVGVILQRPIERSVVVIAKPYVTLRFGVALWKSRTFEIWMFQWPELVWSFPQISAATKQAATFAEPWRRLRKLLLMRATGHYRRGNYERLIARWRLGAWRRIASRLIAELPVPIARGLARWYLTRRGRNTGRLWWELRNAPCGEP